MAGIQIDVHPVWLRAEGRWVDAASQMLSDDEVERAKAFRTAGLRERFILARSSLRVLLAQTLSIKAPEIRFAYLPSGKPFLTSPEADITFNVSHTEDLALYAVAPRRVLLGVDVEKHCNHGQLEDIATGYFADAEILDLYSYSREQRTSAFYRCWVRKEAYIKAVGNGLEIPLDSFRVSLGPEAKLLAIRDGDPREWMMEALSVAVGYEAAVAYRGEAAVVRLHAARSAEHLIATGQA